MTKRKKIEEYLRNNPDEALKIARDFYYWDGSFDYVNTWDLEELCNLGGNTIDIVRAVIYGDVKNIGDPVRYDAYGNLETVYESDVEDEVQDDLDALIDCLLDNPQTANSMSYELSDILEEDDDDEESEEDKEEELEYPNSFKDVTHVRFFISKGKDKITFKFRTDAKLYAQIEVELIHDRDDVYSLHFSGEYNGGCGQCYDEILHDCESNIKLTENLNVKQLINGWKTCHSEHFKAGDAVMNVWLRNIGFDELKREE